MELLCSSNTPQSLEQIARLKGRDAKDMPVRHRAGFGREIETGAATAAKITGTVTDPGGARPAGGPVATCRRGAAQRVRKFRRNSRSGYRLPFSTPARLAAAGRSTFGPPAARRLREHIPVCVLQTPRSSRSAWFRDGILSPPVPPRSASSMHTPAVPRVLTEPLFSSLDPSFVIVSVIQALTKL